MTLTPDELNRLDAIVRPRTGHGWFDLTSGQQRALLDQVHDEVRDAFARNGRELRKLREAAR